LDERADSSVGGSGHLLTDDDPAPVAVENRGGRSTLMLVGDHAGREIPFRLGKLGLGPADLERHIAWDIGVAGLGGLLALRIDAIFVRQRYSRLVIDCNRAPGHPGSIAEVSDGTAIPGNVGSSEADRQARVDEIFEPYHQAVAAVLDERQAAGRATILLALHSFTPSMGGFDRPWRFGVLHRRDSAFSHAILAALRTRWGDEVGDNQPYSMDEIDYTVPRHVDPRGIDYLELEVRQDLIETPAQQKDLIEPLAGVLDEALAALG